MKVLSIIGVFSACAVVVDGIPFVEDSCPYPYGFGIDKSRHVCSHQLDVKKDAFSNMVGEDSVVAQKPFFHAVEAAEKAVLHAVEDEVDLLFHDLGPKLDHTREDMNKEVIKTEKKKPKIVGVGNGSGEREGRKLDHLKERIEEFAFGQIE